MDHRRMLWWANRNLDALEQAIEEFNNANPYGIWSDRDQHTGQVLLRVRATGAGHPEEWEFQIGDIVHNLRVVLDYMAFAHALKRDSTIANDIGRLRNVQFPICTQAEHWSGWLGRLGWASEEMRTLLEALQPYRGPDLGSLHPLVVLDQLDKPHKHRSLLQAAPNITSVDFNLINDPGGSFVVDAMGVEGSFRDGAVVARVRFVGQAGLAGESRARVEFKIGFEVAFGESTSHAGYPVLPLIREVAKYIGYLVPIVEKRI